MFDDSVPAAAILDIFVYGYCEMNEHWAQWKEHGEPWKVHRWSAGRLFRFYPLYLSALTSCTKLMPGALKFCSTVVRWWRVMARAAAARGNLEMTYVP
jgi:hypothetical protein